MITQQSFVSELNGNLPFWLIDQARTATITTFDKICNESICNEVDGIDESAHYDGVIGSISFVGDLTWSLVLGMPRNSAENIAEKFVGCQIDFESPDMGEVVAELVNILAGVLSGQVENAGCRAQMSLPTVARGSDFAMLLSGKFFSQKLNFQTADNTFWVKITVAKY